MAPLPTAISRSIWTWLYISNGNDTPSSKSFIGILAAIGGNILISLALNCQKLAHYRLEKTDSAHGHRESNSNSKKSSNFVSTVEAAPDADDETTREAGPLLAKDIEEHRLSYGSTRIDPTWKQLPLSSPAPPQLTHRATSPTILQSSHPTSVTFAAADINSNRESVSPPQENGSGGVPDSDTQGESTERRESNYLKSKLWWFGFALMNVGEIGNFLSYGFAPASVVAPLGAFALVANCFFAPIMLHERFHRIDLLGMLLAVFGAATVVASAQTSSPHLNPYQLILALRETAFIVYASIVVFFMLILVYASSGELGEQWVVVDVGLCALFGGFTVLSTKAISSLLTLRWFEIYREPIAYPLIVVLLGTGIGQIRYLNRALKKFDSKQVIPTQFVLFNLSAIIGSAVLYGDFRRASFHQFITFLYGCAATFAGVYLLTTSSKDRDEQREEVARSNSDSGRLAAIPEEIPTTPGGSRTLPIRVLRPRRSTAGVGFSPGQYLLLAAPALSTSSTPTKRGRSIDRDRRNSLPSGARSSERSTSRNGR